MAVNGVIDSLPELPRAGEQLEIEANLELEIDGYTFAVSSEDDRIVVHAPSVSACLTAFRSEVGRLPEVANLLAAAGVTVEVRTGEAVLAVVGETATPDWLTAAVFSGAVEVRADGVLTGLLRLQ